MKWHKLWLTAAITLIFLQTAAAQDRWTPTPRVGIAVEDLSSASLVNMAAVGVGNSTGFGWSGYWDSSGETDQTAHLSLGWLAYNYRSFSNVVDHEIGIGFPVFDGFYLGNSVRWSPGEGAGFNSSVLYRPYKWLSMGVKGESLDVNPWMDWGVGLRPMVFSDYWRSRLTLFYDGRVDKSGLYKNLAAGARITPLDGVEFYGHWDFRDEKLITGLNLSWNRFLLGGEAPVAGEQVLTQGSLQTFTSLREMRSLTPRRKHMVFYDMAGVITDTPRLYAEIQDLMPDGKGTRSLFEFIVDMERLENSPQVESVLFVNQEFITSFSNITEIEHALLGLKEAGKQIYFYADRMSSTQYALAASVADEIYMTPRGSLDLTGFGVTKLYFKDLLAKYGVDIVNFRSHEYKTAYDGLSESGMTDAERESLETVYGALQDEMDRMVLTREAKLTGGLDGLYAEGFWMPASRANETGLIDGVMYRDELEEWIDNQGYYVVNFSRLRWDADYEWNPANRSGIALIYANGPVFEGEGTRGWSVGAESLASAIRNARINPLVQSIVLRINSGGGSALASDLIAREVALCSMGDNPKPVVISMAGSAASGGYMIAAPGSRILATPATLTGSIGVIAVVPNLAGLLEYFEVGSDTVTTTESADAPNIFRPLTDTEENLIRNSIKDEYDSFVTLVAENRDMSVEDVEAAARGRIWTGRQAMERGLIDGIGGLDEALKLAEELAGIRNARVLEIDPGNIGFNLPGMPGAAAALLGLKSSDPLEAVPADIRDVVEFYRTLSEFQRGEALYYMPYSLKELGLEERPH